MERGACLGCRTYFDAGERLPTHHPYIELRNFPLPIKDNKRRWALLRMLTAFLNSQGGVLYIGVEDGGEVVGVELSRKEQDEFLLFVKDFVEKIRPAVDLVNREEVVSALSRSAPSSCRWSPIRFSGAAT